MVDECRAEAWSPCRCRGNALKTFADEQTCDERTSLPGSEAAFIFEAPPWDWEWNWRVYWTVDFKSPFREGEPKPRNISYHVIISFVSLVLALVRNTKWKVLRQFVVLFPPHPHN